MGKPTEVMASQLRQDLETGNSYDPQMEVSIPATCQGQISLLADISPREVLLFFINDQRYSICCHSQQYVMSSEGKINNSTGTGTCPDKNFGAIPSKNRLPQQ